MDRSNVYASPARRRAAALFLLAASALAPAARSAIDIEGVGHREVEGDAASFRIVAEAGFTYAATLNGKPVAAGELVEVNRPGYYELAVAKTAVDGGEEESTLHQFIVRDRSRGNSEWGLAPWTPYPLVDDPPSAFGGLQLTLVAPPAFLGGLPLPVIALLEDGAGKAVRLNGKVVAPEWPDERIQLRRGAGSRLFPAPAAGEGEWRYSGRVGGLAADLVVALEDPAAVSWTEVGADLDEDVSFGDNARVFITGDLTVGSGVFVEFSSGTIVRVAPGATVTVEGHVRIDASRERPVVFTPDDPAAPWGGFVVDAADATVAASGAIFTGGGADDDWFSGSGYSAHRKEQATFLFADGATGTFTDCYWIDNPGQALHGDDATITLVRCLVQRGPTVGQFNGGSVTVEASALIEFPLDDGVFNDDDNDGIYFTSGSHRLADTLVGWAKDDGVDAGSGGSGDVTVERCWFESCFHEGMAWSGNSGRDVSVSQTVALNNGQGIEAGFGEPDVTVTGCLAIGNLVGWRFGDNYDWDYDGTLSVGGSIALHNGRDIWGRNWDTWELELDQIEIEGNWISGPDPVFPLNATWDGPADGARLEGFRAVPGADVGVALLARGQQFGLADLARLADPDEAGLEVGLSSFTSVPVTIGYAVFAYGGGGAGAGRVTGRGELLFEPGEIRKRLPLPAAIEGGPDLVRVVLESVSAGAVFTGPRHAVFLPGLAPVGEPGEVLVPTGSTWRYLDDGSDQGTAWREPDFDDGGWASGEAELGYGDGDEATEIEGGPDDDRYPTTYFRHRFNVGDPSALGVLELRLRRDDGAVVYLNGEEVFRSNMPAGAIAFDTFAEDTTSDEDDFRQAEFPADALVAGENVVAVEVHQADADSSDVSFELELTARPALPVRLGVERSAGELVLYWAGDGVVPEVADALDGTWTTLEGAASPIVVFPYDALIQSGAPAAGGVGVEGGRGAKFFRLRRR